MTSAITCEQHGNAADLKGFIQEHYPTILRSKAGLHVNRSHSPTWPGEEENVRQEEQSGGKKGGVI